VPSRDGGPQDIREREDPRLCGDPIPCGSDPRPWLRFHISLIEPDWRIARIRLSDKTSRLHPRRATTKLGQAYEAEMLV